MMRQVLSDSAQDRWPGGLRGLAILCSAVVVEPDPPLAQFGVPIWAYGPQVDCFGPRRCGQNARIFALVGR